MVYEQTLQATSAKMTTTITSVPEQPSVALPNKPRSDTTVPIFDLTSNHSPPKPIAAISPNMERRRSCLGTTKSTPPKKRFVNYPLADGRGATTQGKCNLSDAFKSDVKASAAAPVVVNNVREQQCTLVCLDSSDDSAEAVEKEVEDVAAVALKAVKVSTYVFLNYKSKYYYYMEFYLNLFKMIFQNKILEVK